MKIEGFDWDSSNEFKNEKKRGITREAIEEFFHGKIYVAPDVKHSSKEDRFLAVGKGPGDRPMFVAFTFRVNDKLKLIRPITARFMHAKEVKKYEEAFAKNEK